MGPLASKSRLGAMKSSLVIKWLGVKETTLLDAQLPYILPERAQIRFENIASKRHGRTLFVLTKERSLKRSRAFLDLSIYWDGILRRLKGIWMQSIYSVVTNCWLFLQQDLDG